MKKLTYISMLIISQLIFAQSNKVGINKSENLRAEVDVNGNVSLETVEKANSDNLKRLYIKNESRRLAVLPSNKKPFTILHYKLEPKEGSDWLKDVNLRIKVKDYFLVVSSAHLENYKWEENLRTFPNPIIWGTSHTFKNGDPNGDVYNAIQKVDVQNHAYEGDDNEFWHLTADIFGSSPYCYNSIRNDLTPCKWYYWDVTILAFDNTLVKPLGMYRASSKTGDTTNILENLKNSAK